MTRAIHCPWLLLSLQLVQEQKVAVRRAIEDAADRLPWWVQPVLPRGSLFDNAGLVHGAGGFEQLNVPYSDEEDDDDLDDDDDDDDSSSSDEEGRADDDDCDCDVCVERRMMANNTS